MLNFASGLFIFQPISEGLRGLDAAARSSDRTGLLLHQPVNLPGLQVKLLKHPLLLCGDRDI